eukprot:gnl/Ergobibamus_cyprinoides/1954.p2 GENE.gnl/Ergobibamus_cyprinoides/1954~~gnl/Ergobibamus_cyprinoides/1954.p2  ORF type:complete len:120 (+),score=17.03 gnl/Ergobibamus_cyprinoides/1954:167-526(+)
MAASEHEPEPEIEAPLYNPKNVPLDFDGAPIPYWLYRLNGLSVTFSCEICGGAKFQGRRNFERHFGDRLHALGLEKLGIPNSADFFGVTGVAEAQALWTRLRRLSSAGLFDPEEEQERQ